MAFKLMTIIVATLSTISFVVAWKAQGQGNILEALFFMGVAIWIAIMAILVRIVEN